MNDLLNSCLMPHKLPTKPTFLTTQEKNRNYLPISSRHDRGKRNGMKSKILKSLNGLKNSTQRRRAKKINTKGGAYKISDWLASRYKITKCKLLYSIYCKYGVDNR